MTWPPKKTNDKLIAATLDGVKDFCWSMFWRGKQVANLSELEERCMRLIRATSQKLGSSAKTKDPVWRENKGFVDWDMLDMDLLMIAMEACAFVLDKRFPELRDQWEVESDAIMDQIPRIERNCPKCDHYLADCDIITKPGDRIEFRYTCKRCGAHTPNYIRKEQAIDAWNAGLVFEDKK